MEKWEVRYEHDRDVQKAQCVSRGLPIPEEDYGKLSVIKNLFQSFNAKKFWPELEKLGHDSMDPDSCKCRRKIA